MITLKDIHHTYVTDAREEVVALSGIDLVVHDQEIVVLVGPSGCGKSTLLSIMAGFMAPTSGQCLLDGGTPVTGPGTDRGVVFQRDNLFPWLRVRENVALGSTFSGSQEARASANQLIDVVGLGDAADRYPHELSGGMRQRAQIARVLATSPRTVLMDEPFGALDPFTRRQLQAELLSIWARSTPTIVFITHSVEEAVLLADRVVVMGTHPGQILAEVNVPAGLRSRLRESGADLNAAVTDPQAVELRAQVNQLIQDAHGV